MSPPDWAGEADSFVRAFAERAATWDQYPGDLVDGASEPWTDPDHPDPVLDAAYRSGIVPAAERWCSDTPFDNALTYARRGWPVFPCHWQGERRKRPLVGRGLYAATAAAAQIRQWWTRWPRALIGLPTGKASGFVVLDIDTKDPAANGYDTLKALGRSDLPDTPMAHTASGGAHVYFAVIGIEIRNSIGRAGLGPGLDVRGEGGYVIVPSIGSGYSWDQHRNFDTAAPLPAPAWLGHREKSPARQAPHAARRFDADTVLTQACDNIRNAHEGDKYRTVRREPFIVACLVRDGFLSERQARHEIEAALVQLGRRAQNHEAMVKAYEGAFAEGLAAPSRTAGRHR
jgi:putative DNA primase/helicase